MSFVYRAPKHDISSNSPLNNLEYQHIKGFADEMVLKYQEYQGRPKQSIPQKTQKKSIAAGSTVCDQSTQTISNIGQEKWMIGKDITSDKVQLRNSQLRVPEKKLTSVFLSTTVRDILPKLTDESSPGPGHYKVSNAVSSVLKQKKIAESGQNYQCRSLCNDINDSYERVISIPMESKRDDRDDQSSFGIRSNPSNNITNKENQRPRLECIANESNANKRCRGADFHTSKVERKVFVPPKDVLQMSINSTYLTDIAMQIAAPLKESKQPKKISEKWKKPSTCQTASTGIIKCNEDKNSDCDSDEEEYIETTPGPGSYNYETSSFVAKDFRSKKPEARKIFMTKEERLKEIKVQTKVGPTSYNIKEPKQPVFNTPMDAGFLAVDSRFKPLQPEYIAESGLYRPRLSIQNDLLNRLIKGFKGRFGTNVQRFESNETAVPGPGAYQCSDIQKLQTTEEKQKLSHSYKSLVKRNLFDNIPNFPGPGKYQIEKNVSRKHEEFEELAPKKIPFNSSSERKLFVVKTFGAESPLSPLKRDLNKSSQKEANSSPFKSKVDRFIPQSLFKTPGVGQYYSAEKDAAAWQTPTYNVLFKQF